MNSLIRRQTENPFTDLAPISKLMDEFFDSKFPSLSSTFGGNIFQKVSYPKVDLLEKPDKFVVKASLPGHKKEEISVTLQDNILTVSASSSEKIEEENCSYCHREIKLSSCSRSIVLPEEAVKDITVMTANHENGILSIDIPKIKVTEKPTIQTLKIN